ncbi:MAG: energy-coupling factor ABC transporter ATP-binding protein [bacterium]
MNSKPVIEFDNVSWTYEGETDPAIDSVSLSIKPGESVGIVGSNEQGKTTLARCMNGLIPYSHMGVLDGTVRIDGEDVTDLSQSDIARTVGMVFSDPEAQFTSMSVEEELLFGLENLGLDLDEIEQRLDWICERLDLTPLLDSPPYDLSGGQKQRVAIGSVMVMQPEVIVLDEPTSMLDPVSKREIFDLLDELREEQDLTMVVIEHNLQQLLPRVDRIIHLKQNTVHFAGETQQFVNQYNYDEGDVYMPEVAQLFARRTEGSAEDIPYMLDTALELEA